jgi:hypothetical protein
MTTQEKIDLILMLDRKKMLLSEIVVWLKAKGLWEDCQKDLVTKIVPTQPEKTKDDQEKRPRP